MKATSKYDYYCIRGSEMKKSAIKISLMVIKIAAVALVIGCLTNHAKGNDPTANLSIKLTPPTYFTVGELVENPRGDGTWSITLMRKGAASSYGAYTITYTEEGYDPANTTIEGFPSINPFAQPEPLA